MATEVVLLGSWVVEVKTLAGLWVLDVGMDCVDCPREEEKDEPDEPAGKARHKCEHPPLFTAQGFHPLCLEEWKTRMSITKST